MKNIFFVIFLTTSLAGCGPVNSKPLASIDALGGQKKSSNELNKSKGSQFLVYVTNTTTKETPLVGDNTYAVRFVYNDLHLPSIDAKVNVTYWMPDMPTMGKENTTGVRQADGSFNINLFFSMPGRWEMTVKLEDAQTQDEYVFETKL